MAIDVSLLGPGEDREQILNVFRRSYSGTLPDDFIPEEDDSYYCSFIAKAVDTASGRVIGAAMSHRTKQSVEAQRFRHINPHGPDYAPVAGRHSELGMITVDEDYRGQGIGSRLISALEAELQQSGVRLWLGHTELGSHLEELDAFYRRHGFNVLLRGERVPPFFGRDWVTLVSPDTAWCFYKMLEPRAQQGA